MIAERFAPDLGGVARSAVRTASAIARLDWDVHVLAWTKTLPPGVLETIEPDDASPTAAGVTLHRLGLFSSWDFSLQHTTNVLEWLHHQFHFTVVWGHYVYPAGYMAVVFGDAPSGPTCPCRDIEYALAVLELQALDAVFNRVRDATAYLVIIRAAGVPGCRCWAAGLRWYLVNLAFLQIGRFSIGLGGKKLPVVTITRPAPWELVL